MTDSNRHVADQLILDILDRLEKKNPNDKEFGSEVRALLNRIKPNTIQLLRIKAIENASNNS